MIRTRPWTLDSATGRSLTSQGSGGCGRWTRVGRELAGHGEEIEVDISSRNLTLKRPNGTMGGVAGKRREVHRRVISFWSY